MKSIPVEQLGELAKALEQQDVHASPRPSDLNEQKPVFGAGRGTLTIVSEDEEHLKDFHEYMK